MNKDEEKTSEALDVLRKTPGTGPGPYDSVVIEASRWLIGLYAVKSTKELQVGAEYAFILNNNKPSGIDWIERVTFAGVASPQKTKRDDIYPHDFGIQKSKGKIFILHNDGWNQIARTEMPTFTLWRDNKPMWTYHAHDFTQKGCYSIVPLSIQLPTIDWKRGVDARQRKRLDDNLRGVFG